MAFIRKFLDLSTAHLAKEDREFLDAESDKAADHPSPDVALCSRTQYGWFLYAYDCAWGLRIYRVSENVTRIMGLSENITRIMTYARRHGAEYVLFDADAPVDPDLAVFEEAE